MSNPSAGRIIKYPLHDPMLPTGSVKMAQNIYTHSQGGIEIHYVWDPASNTYFDFKFK